MKALNTILAAAAAVVALVSCSGGAGKPIKTDVPKRPAGQKSALLMRAPALDTVRVGFVGLGGRGSFAVTRWVKIPGTRVVALCDLYEDNVENVQKTLENAGRPKAALYFGGEEEYKKLCERDDIDLVYIATDWKHHAPIAKYAMEHGKHAVIEVPGATTLEEIWDLVNTCERTRKHCMMLENCTYDFFEMTVLNMVQAGLFGEVTHAEGGYLHCRVGWKNRYDNWRLRYNKNNRGDVYPTHGLGPICEIMNIHRGDRLKLLVSVDTKSYNGPEWWKRNEGEDIPSEEFANGDITSTLITTENGKTILIEHNTMDPRPYSRMFRIQGTRAYAEKEPIEVISMDPRRLDSTRFDLSGVEHREPLPKEILDVLMEEYKDPIHKEIEAMAKEIGGHGGMDFVMDWRLVYCLRNGLPLDMDVYDMAEWCAIQPLSRLSLESGNMPVEVPDFTRGEWKKLSGYRHFFAGE